MSSSLLPENFSNISLQIPVEKISHFKKLQKTSNKNNGD